MCSNRSVIKNTVCGQFAQHSHSQTGREEGRQIGLPHPASLSKAAFNSGLLKVQLMSGIEAWLFFIRRRWQTSIKVKTLFP